MDWVGFLSGVGGGEFVIVGAIGGLARALYGLYKATGRSSVVNMTYFISTVILSGIIGGLIGAIFKVDFRIAGLAGYVGTDILENVFSGLLPSSITLEK